MGRRFFTYSLFNRLFLLVRHHTGRKHLYLVTEQRFHDWIWSQRNRKAYWRFILVLDRLNKGLCLSNCLYLGSLCSTSDSQTIFMGSTQGLKATQEVLLFSMGVVRNSATQYLNVFGNHFHLRRRLVDDFGLVRNKILRGSVVIFLGVWGRNSIRTLLEKIPRDRIT